MSLSLKPLVQTMQARTSMIRFSDQAPSEGVNIVGVEEGGTLTCGSDHVLCARAQDAVRMGPFTKGKIAVLGKDLVLVGLGKTEDSGPEGVQVFDQDQEKEMRRRCKWRQFGGLLWKEIMSHPHVVVPMQGLSAEQALDVAYGLAMKMWRFEHHRTSARPLSPVKCTSITIVHDKAALLADQWAQEKHLVDAVHWAREMANHPGSCIVPSTFVENLQDFREDGLEVQILDQAQMREKGFGALLGVAQGSDSPPYLAVITWKGEKTDQPPIALVGKGVTFDSGGLSIKSSRGMEDMKLDKTGAVVVCATMRALARRKSPTHVVAVVALVENMVSGRAQRPGDIVTSLSGQSIEVLNTDAEGRLILADALTYVQNTFKPRCIVDVATLTGAVCVALGPVYAGLFSNSQKLMKDLSWAGHVTGERLWPLPLGPSYDRALNCDVADMKNITSPDFGAGSSTAAQFLQRFVEKDLSWAHLDIASVDHLTSDHPLCPKGGSAFGVQLLTRWIESQKTI